MLMAWKFYKRISKITFFVMLAFLLLLVHITLGMLTVQTKTLPVVVTAHLGMVTLVFASALITRIFSFINPRGYDRIVKGAGDAIGPTITTIAVVGVILRAILTR